MSVPALCPNCGLSFTSRLFNFQDSTDITVMGCTETCPRCGKQANVQDGTYDFVGRVLAAIRAPGVLRDDVVAFRKIAEDVQSGKISSEDATLQISKINAAFVALWTWMNESGAAIGVVLMVLALYATIWAKEADDAGSEQAHQDAQRMVRVQEQIYEALQAQSALAQSQAAQQPPTQSKPSLSPAQRPKTAGPENRKERRAAAARARHYPRP